MWWKSPTKLTCDFRADLRGLPNTHLINMDVAVVGDVGGDTASAMHHFFAASPQVKVDTLNPKP